MFFLGCAARPCQSAPPVHIVFTSWKSDAKLPETKNRWSRSSSSFRANKYNGLFSEQDDARMLVQRAD